MNSYFASVEQQANPFLRDKSIAVTGKRYDPSRDKEPQRSIVAAASAEAKRQGIKTGMSTWEAKRICPRLIIVQGDPKKYSDITEKIFHIFREFSDCVEQFSVDEGFLDVTHEAEDYLGAIMIALAIKKRINEICGEYIKASIGIAPNKLIAKLASESQKPDGLVVVPRDQVLDFV